MRTNQFIVAACVSVLMISSLDRQVHAASVPVTTGLLAHFDAQTGSSVLNPGASPASDGQFVGTWEDLVSTHDASPFSVSAQPIYNATGGPNSLPVISFDGVNDNLVTATTLTSPRTILLFHRWDAEAGTNYLLDARTGVTNGYVYDGTASGLGPNWTSYYVNGSTTAGTALAQIQSDTWQMTTFYGSSAGTDFLRLMSRYTDASGYGLGAIGEVLIYDRVITQSERLELFDYVDTRWVNLPPAPEPSSFLLLGIGGMGLIRHTRRRRQQNLRAQNLA